MTKFQKSRVTATGRIEIELRDGNGTSVKSFSHEEAIALMQGLTEAVQQRQQTLQEAVE